MSRSPSLKQIAETAKLRPHFLGVQRRNPALKAQNMFADSCLLAAGHEEIAAGVMVFDTEKVRSAIILAFILGLEYAETEK